MVDFAELITWIRSWPAAKVAIDAADVLIVAVVFYRLLVLVRGTRAMQMAIGLAFVFLVYHFARYIGLISLYAILDTLLTSIVVLIVVIFQNDIRRLLARVGQRPLIRGVRSAREVQAIEDVVKATAVLAQRHIGALIVFERNASLDEFVEHGTEIDSELTKELLYALFVASPDNPLHDGAVIVREGRVWQAGCHLPLSGSSKLDRSLGTRHRAAIGISEETDAVVVVVSEERGSVSLCFNGNMVRGLETADLRHALLGLFQAPARKKAREASGKRSTTGDRPSSAGRPAAKPVQKSATASTSSRERANPTGSERSSIPASAEPSGGAASLSGSAIASSSGSTTASGSTTSSGSSGAAMSGSGPTRGTTGADPAPGGAASAGGATSASGSYPASGASGATTSLRFVAPVSRNEGEGEHSGPDRLSSADIGASRERSISKEERP